MNKNEMMERQMAALEDMTMAELKARFLELYGFECGATNARGLRHRLAYKLQKIYLGGLSEEDRKKIGISWRSWRKKTPWQTSILRTYSPGPPQRARDCAGNGRGKLTRSWSGMTEPSSTTGKFTVRSPPSPGSSRERTGTERNFSG